VHGACPGTLQPLNIQPLSSNFKSEAPGFLQADNRNRAVCRPAIHEGDREQPSWLVQLRRVGEHWSRGQGDQLAVGERYRYPLSRACGIAATVQIGVIESIYQVTNPSDHEFIRSSTHQPINHQLITIPRFAPDLVGLMRAEGSSRTSKAKAKLNISFFKDAPVTSNATTAHLHATNSVSP